MIHYAHGTAPRTEYDEEESWERAKHQEWSMASVDEFG